MKTAATPADNFTLWLTVNNVACLQKLCSNWMCSIGSPENSARTQTQIRRSRENIHVHLPESIIIPDQQRHRTKQVHRRELSHFKANLSKYRETRALKSSHIKLSVQSTSPQWIQMISVVSNSTGRHSYKDEVKSFFTLVGTLPTRVRWTEPKLLKTQALYG